MKPQTKERTYPIVELFGPTVQGEGPSVGARCWFLRLGGCDYRCTWCDSLIAVTPELVRKAPRLNVQEILLQLSAKGLRKEGLLILSGGNPALHHLDPLLDELDGVRVHVETQGTKFRPWLNRAELVVVSPKPPSAWATDAGQQARKGVEVAQKFLFNVRTRWVLKMVVFNEEDLSWASWAHMHLAGGVGFEGTFLSAGTDQQATDLAGAVVERYRWLANAVLERPVLADVRIGLQAHQLVWPGELAR